MSMGMIEYFESIAKERIYFLSISYFSLRVLHTIQVVNMFR